MALKELGPRFTLKLRSLQKGTFNSKHGHYEWIQKVRSSSGRGTIGGGGGGGSLFSEEWEFKMFSPL